MLVVVAEVNCLEYLQRYNIFPDEFYTDFELFKKKASMLSNASLMIITAGACRFNRKHLVEFIKEQRQENLGTAFSEIVVLSDIDLPYLNDYYKYHKDLFNSDKKNSWKVVEKNINPLRNYISAPKETTVFLQQRDDGVVDDLIDYYKGLGDREDEYIGIIKVPNVKKMLGIE